MRTELILAVSILSISVGLIVFWAGYYLGKRKAFAMMDDPESSYVMANFFLGMLKAFDENKLSHVKDSIAMMARIHVSNWKMYERKLPARRLEAIRKMAPNLKLIDDAEKWCGRITDLSEITEPSEWHWLARKKMTESQGK
jgi:hypothetical protein